MNQKNGNRIIEYDIHIAKKIREALSYKKVSRKNVAEYLDISVQQLQKYELGINRISAGKLGLIAEILNIHITYFYKDINKTI